MKIKAMFTMTVIAFFGITAAFGQTKSEKFEVKGNCGMCENRIEKAAKSVDGVSAADWNQETKMLELSFNESKTSVDKVQQAVANVGHDTPKHKAKDDVYNELPGCCKYDRTGTKKEMKGHEGHNH